ncbi:hypothetical protein [Wohlfahrtiimonas populi]|uniref:hypothetical protein n=1 Tax=Wohlfahrtiimonas populi TaxID=1940240 RepID=UPI00098D0BD0|nr:hypothetical protein [Wohlfahrtiimonas populi]
MKTAYIVQTFTRQGNAQSSKLFNDPAVQCNTAEEAMNRAERFSEMRAGVLAISQAYDETTGDYGEMKVLAHYGEIPDGALGYDD